ncbi:MAG: helix-turn-helix transcriptional regulator [Ktedonobacteraceae bacterium]|nr:helix-turn-helix transcriptional regulator [Ktedonobacteraceae bacterium]
MFPEGGVFVDKEVRIPMSRLAHVEDYSPGLYGLPHMGEVIADHRIKAGWTSQEAFAIVCGVDKQTVAYWENQRYLADMERRILLSKLLKIPPTLLGLTWYSMGDDNTTHVFPNASNSIGELLEENAYALYEDILTFAHASKDKYSPTAAYRFKKHQQELEQIIHHVPAVEIDAWKDLLSRFYQHSTFIAQHHKKDEEALLLADKAVSLAESLNDAELLGTSLYRRSRVHLVQSKQNSARTDIKSALEKIKRAKASIKGSSYLLSAEVNSIYAEGDEELKAKCRIWQENASKLLYNGKVEEDGTFLTFNLYAVHHERAKTLLRFSLFYTSDNELTEKLKGMCLRANKELLIETRNALSTARKHLEPGSSTGEMNLSITEARIYLAAREFEEGAKIAKVALQFARKSHSQQGIEEVKQIYAILHQLDPTNPYIANLGMELKIFPTK